MKQFSINRRSVLRGLGASAASVASLASLTTLGPWADAHAQEDFPMRPVALWVPWPAGGATDITMRLLAELAGQHLGEKVIVNNRSGAGGTLAMPVLQQAAPDGYTVAQMPQPVFRAPHTQKVLWDPIRDTTPIIQISGVTFGVVVPTHSAFKTFDDLLTFAAKNPGELSVATNGAGTTPHVVMDELSGQRGISYIHVPYRGTSEQMIAVSSGQVMAGINSNGFAPFVDTGRMRLLATFAEQRSKRWPTVPTLKELGYGISASSPYGLAGPRGMSPAVVRKLHDAFKLAMFDPQHVAELAKFDQELAYLNTEDYGRATRQTFAAERRTVDRLGLAKLQ